MNEDSELVTVADKEALRPKNFPLTEEDKAQWAKRFGESGLSIRKFCAQHNLPRMSLWRWVNQRQEFKQTVTASAPLQFEEVKLAAPVGESHWAAELTLPNGTMLRLSRDLPVAIFEQLLRLC